VRSDGRQRQQSGLAWFVAMVDSRGRQGEGDGGLGVWYAGDVRTSA
jgi:hypothetical protein